MVVNEAIVKRALEALRALSQPDRQESNLRVYTPPDRNSPGCPGPELCAGCYSVGIIDGRERFIHPPRASEEWLAWLARWQPRGKLQ
ncbi:MAG TPA: hypothetical protein VFC10_18495 [Terriglobia bacterium]|jgi:hypothetical protein|nr:hypothetical protein [Terriglobia bacterium]